MLYKFYDFFDPYYEAMFRWLGFSPAKASQWANYSELLVAFLLAGALFYVVRFVLRRAVVRIANKTRDRWDSLLLQNRMLHKASYFAPGILLDMSVRHILGADSEILHGIEILLKIYYAVILAILLNTFITVLLNLILQRSAERPLPIRGIAQIFRVIIFVLLGLFIISTFFDIPPRKMFTGFGAATAITILIFRDTILGLVGGIQLVAYDMVREGDWISMPKHDVDGDVIDISLTTVKVQNWDKTISTIPTYALVSESMRNWRGMEKSGGRRIKRSIPIDMNSVTFCTPEMLERFKQYDFLQDYIAQKEQEIQTHNEQKHIDSSVLLNGRRLTNLGIFRVYLLEYLRHTPEIHKDMISMVRQLPPTDKGIPLEIYAFSRRQDWVAYEDIQSDIFDHILAAMPAFDLQVFQTKYDNAEM